MSFGSARKTPGSECPLPLAGIGLRERTKARRRDQIQRAAMRLFAQQGYERTTIVEIADAADVAPRTIAAYFPTKLDMATAYADAAAARAAAMLTLHADEGILAGFDHWLRSEETEFYDPELAALADAMYEANPELDAIGSAHVSSAMEAGKLALTTEFGADVDPLKLRLGAAAVKATLASYMREINANGVSETAHQALLEVVAALLDAIGSRASGVDANQAS